MIAIMLFGSLNLFARHKPTIETVHAFTSVFREIALEIVVWRQILNDANALKCIAALTLRHGLLNFIDNIV